MNKATALFAITTVILAATSLYLAQSLHVERARLAAVVAVQPQPSSPTPEPLQQRPATPTPEPPSVPGDRATPAVQSSKPAEKKSESALPSRVVNRSARSADLAIRRLDMEQRYVDLAAALNLQPEEAARVFDLLAKQNLADAEDEMAAMRAGAASGRERQRERDRRQQANSAELAALLGEDRAADWNEYMNSLGARSEVRALRVRLADSDFRLRREQYEPLVQALATEQVRHNAEREKLRQSLRDPTHPTPRETIEYMDRRLDLIEDSLARRRRAAESILDSEQLRGYQAMLDRERLQRQAEYDSTVTANAQAAQEKSRVNR
jgi:hypothetical protein